MTQNKPPTELELHGLFLGVCKMEPYISMMGDEPFYIYTDHLPLLSIVEHMDASRLRSMDRIVIERHLRYICQFKNLRLEYVPGEDNIADLFSRPPFVRTPTASALSLTPRAPEESRAPRRKVEAPSSNVNVVVTRAQRQREAAGKAQPSAPKDTNAHEAASALHQAMRKQPSPSVAPSPTPLPQQPPKDKDELIPVTPPRKEATPPKDKDELFPTTPSHQDATPQEHDPAMDDISHQAWRARASTVRPEVFNLDVFEEVAKSLLTGRGVPAQYQAAIFTDTVESVQRHLPDLELRSGRLFHTGQQSGFYTRLELRDDVMFAAHSAPTGGHYAMRGTLGKCNGVAWWDGIAQDVALKVDLCELCRRNKHSRAPGRGGALPAVGVNERVHIDLIIMPTPSKGGETVIAQAIDAASKWVQSAAFPNRSAKPIARWFYESWCLMRGIPIQLTCDRELAFIGSFNAAMQDALGVRVRPTSGYNPMSNGQAENPHRHYTTILRCLSNPNDPDWAEWLPQADFACNTATPRTTRTSPFFLQYGRIPVTPVNIMAGVFAPTVDANDEADLVSWYRALHRARELAANLEGRARGAATPEELETPTEPTIKKGELYLLRVDGDKLDPLYEGPYRVIDAQPDAHGLSALLELVHDPRQRIWRNRRQLRPYTGRAAPVESRVWEIGGILAERGKPPHDEFFVSFVGFSEQHNMWVAREQLQAVELLSEWKKLPGRERKRLSDIVLSKELSTLDPAPALPMHERILVDRVVDTRATRTETHYLVLPQGAAGPHNYVWVRARDVANPDVLDSGSK